MSVVSEKPLQVSNKCLHVILELLSLSKEKATYSCNKCEEEFEVER